MDPTLKFFGRSYLVNTLNAKYICGNKDRFTSNLQGKKNFNNWIIYFQCSVFDQIYSGKILDGQINSISYRPDSGDFSKMPTKQMESPTYHCKSHLPHDTFSLGLMR